MSDRRRSVRLAAAVSSILSAPAIAVGAGLAIALAAAPVAQAQETASQLNGYVVSSSGEPITGAKVTILHVPSGTTSTVTTTESGQFIATGLRVGGPYRVTAKAEGMQDAAVEELYTQIGQRTSVTLVAQPIAQLAGVEVTGASERDVTIGAGSRFGAQEVRELPSISRDIKDVVRIDPKAWIDPTNSDALEIAGVNNRYNTITVDGVRQSDDFGLNNNGYPTQRSPLSVDAIESFTVLSAPFSVEYSSFRGSTINVVTKSGTNEFTGSAYYYSSDDSMVGDKSKDRDLEFTFDEETYGGTLGGPIIKDKLFFFLNYEKLDRTAPQDFGPAGSGYPVEISGVTQAEYDQILGIAQSVYAFDAGSNRLATLPEVDEKILAKIDWNLSDTQRASFAYQHTEGNEVITSNNSSSQNRISAPSNWYNRAIVLDSYSAQLFSDWNEFFSTELKVARKEVEVRQDSLQGTDFAEMQIRTPTGGTMFIGPDEFRHANYLTNDLDTIKLKGNFFLGDHTVTVGYEREMLDIFNVFVPRSQGQYIFSSITNFENQVATNFNYTNAFTNNSDDGAASFGYDVDSFYVQNEWQANPDFKIQAGVRMDKFSSSDKPLLNDNFTDRYGYTNLSTLDGRDLLMPRIGFNWQWRPETTIYGGWGLFGGGTPNVWISNSFSNDGVAVVQTNVSATTNPALAPFALNGMNGFDIPQEVQDFHETLRGDGPVNAVDPDFEIPSQYRWNLGIKHTLPWDVEMTADVIVSRVKDEVLWQDIRLVQTGTAPDGRPRYSPAADGRTSGSIQDFLLTNTGGGEGNVYTIDFTKTWRTGAGRFDAYFGYGYQDIKDINPGTSSTASSNWDNLAVADPNNPELSTSNYEIEHQFKGQFTWRKAFFGDYETSVALVGERRSGRPYSFTFGGGSPQSVWGDPRQASRQRQLFYVPASPTDVIYEALCTAADVTAGVAGCASTTSFSSANAAAAQFASDMEAYIDQQGLSKWRGRIVPRNSHTSAWLSVLDLRLSQELPIWRKSRGVLTLDVENLANMIDSDWGQLRKVSFAYFTPVVDVNRIDSATNRYVYRPRSGRSGPVSPSQSLSALPSVWRVQLGVRIEF
ncbi:MAG TPA: carboxypeptidase regulatory-like domain-containing protein [Steroidobacteraceae bacterium]